MPGDFSAAAPFVVAATLLPGSELTIHDVGLNPRASGLLDVLERMGARITLFNRHSSGGEPVGDLEVRSAELTATAVDRRSEVPRLVDELPLFALAAGLARGESTVRGAEELRVKETDRIETVTNSLRALGVRVTREGRRLPGQRRAHSAQGRAAWPRTATTGSPCSGPWQGSSHATESTLEDAEAVAVSFPGFFELLDSVTQR